MDLLIGLFFFVLILFVGLLIFVTYTIKQITKRYKSLEEVNVIRKENLEIQKKYLMNYKI